MSYLTAHSELNKIVALRSSSHSNKLKFCISLPFYPDEVNNTNFSLKIFITINLYVDAWKNFL